MRLLRRGSVSTFLLATVVSTAAAQQQRPGIVEVPERERRGLWLAASLGAGAESYAVSGDPAGYSGTLTKPTISFRIGGTVGPHWRLGGEALVWIHEVSDATASLSSFLFVGQWYPSRAGGLYLKGGAGLGRNGVDFSDGYSVGDLGFALSGGAGYEIPLGRRFALVPAADFVQHFYGGGRGLPGYRERLLHVGLGILFQTGR